MVAHRDGDPSSIDAELQLAHRLELPAAFTDEPLDERMVELSALRQ